MGLGPAYAKERKCRCNSFDPYQIVLGGTSTRGPCIRGVFEHVQPPPCSKSICSPEHPCPDHNNVRAPRAYDHQSIHAQTIITFVFKSIRSPEHPCPNHNNVRVPRAYAHQSIHAQTIITFVFQEHTITRASMSSLYASNPKKSLANGISTFYTPPESFVFFYFQNMLFAVAKPLKSLKMLTRLSVLGPPQNKPLNCKSATKPNVFADFNFPNHFP